QNPPQDRKVQLGKGDYGVMQTGRDRGLNKPEALSEHQARRREWDHSADIIRASGFCCSRARASLRDQPLALPAWDQQEETEQSDSRTDCLNLAFLVDGQHKRPLRRVEVEADD